MRKLISAIPNFLTSMNVFSGCIAIVLAFQHNLVLSVIFIFIAAVFDFLDGFSARLLKAYSEMGKELDSLADMVSFGVAPSVLVFVMLSDNISVITSNSLAQYLLPFMAFIIAVFSALRLAKFNIDDRQTTSFIGMPTPANAVFFASLALLQATDNESFLRSVINNPVVLMFLVLVFSFLLVSELPMFSLKLKSFSWKEYKIQFIFIGLSLLLLILLQLVAIPIVILLYILLSILKLVI